MMRFAIVDDESDVPEQIAEMLKNYVPDIQIETNCFHQPSEFLEMYYNCNYDAVFLDIDMPAINGFDLSQQIYEKNNSIPIVYITSRDDLIIHAFRYKPLGFVRKQFIASELPYALTTILKEINQKSPSITITETRFAGGRTYCIQIEKITFLESEKHNVKIQLLTGESYTVREALSYYLNLPEFKDFVLINSGTMVNLAHIKLVSETISLKNGTILYVSRRKLQSVLDAYLKYIGRVLI